MGQRMNELTVPGELTERIHAGSFASVAYSQGLDTYLAKRYGRPGLCLKIFPKLKGGAPDAFLWTGKPVAECTRVQNLFALHNLAPLVLDTVLLNGLHVAQVTEYADSKGAPDLPLMRALIEQNTIRCENRHNDREQWDLEFDANWRGGWFVDFGGWSFGDPRAYEARLLWRVSDVAREFNDFRKETAPARLRRIYMELANWLGHWELLQHIEGAG
jgi:hypothetical protein